MIIINKLIANYVQQMTADLIEDFEPMSKYDRIRVNIAKVMLAHDLEAEKPDSGLYGKVFELLHRSPNSKITEVRKQGQVDLFIQVDGRLRPCEVKTNCGRIGSLYDIPEEKRMDSYILYTICRVKPAGTHVRKDGTVAPAEEWYLPPIIMSVADFLADVERFNAKSIVGHGESDKEPNVRGDKDKFYRYLLNRKSTYYERGATYEAIL